MRVGTKKPRKFKKQFAINNFVIYMLITYISRFLSGIIMAYYSPNIFIKINLKYNLFVNGDTFEYLEPKDYIEYNI